MSDLLHRGVAGVGALVRGMATDRRMAAWVERVGRPQRLSGRLCPLCGRAGPGKYCAGGAGDRHRKRRRVDGDALTPIVARGLRLLRWRRRLAEADAVDRRVRALKGAPPITCRGVGCNGCCRGEVLVLPVELDRIVGRMDDAAWARVAAVAGALIATPKRAPCPLLDPETGGCSVFDERPLACRGYRVVSPPEDCDPESGEATVAMAPTPGTLEALLALADDGAEVLGAALVARWRDR